MYRPLIFLLFVVMVLPVAVKAQADSAGTFIYEGKSFNTKIYYGDSDTLLAFGNYIAGTLIKHGEWMYFYKNGKVSKDIYFHRDMKCGTWIYYNEDGSVQRKEKYHEHLTLNGAGAVFLKAALLVNGFGKSKSERERWEQKQATERAKNSY